MTSGIGQRQLRAALWLTLIIAIGWIVCFWPARMLRGQDGVFWMTVAAVCCLIPGWIVVFISALSVFPNDLSAMMVQMLVRLGVVGGTAVIVKRMRPELGPVDFFGWLVGFYCLALAAEVVLLKDSARKAESGGAPGGPAPADQDGSSST